MKQKIHTGVFSQYYHQRRGLIDYNESECFILLAYFGIQVSTDDVDPRLNKVPPSLFYR